MREAPRDQGGFLGPRAFEQFIYGGESFIFTGLVCYLRAFGSDGGTYIRING